MEADTKPAPAADLQESSQSPEAPVTWNGMVVPSVADEPDHGNDRVQGSPED